MAWRIPPSAIERVRSLQFRSYSPADDLSCLASLKPERTTDAVAFYAARIAETTCWEAVHRIDQALSKRKSVEHIDYLRFVGVLDDRLGSVFHSLRRLGNHARHRQRAIQPSEEGTVVALLRRVVQWSATALVPQPQADSPATQETWAPAAERLLDAVLFSDDAETQRGQPALIGQLDALVSDPTLCCMAAERLIDLGLFSAARDFLAETRTRYRKVREIRNRLDHLEALRLSRAGEPEAAVALLEPWIKQGELPELPLGKRLEEIALVYVLESAPPEWRADVELPGILAGAKKRIWAKTQDVRHLEDAHRLYRTAWWGAPLSFYAGGNAAATALWLGRRDVAGAIAGFLLRHMDGIEERLADAALPKMCSDHYRLATLAELQLIAGKTEQAREAYAAAREAASKGGGPWHVTVAQLDANLRILMPGTSAEAFLAASSGEATEALSQSVRDRG